MYSTDFLGINDHTVFTTIRNSLPAKAAKKTQNIITVRDSVLYAWNFRDNSVLTLNLKNAVNHQTLLPTSPPYFTPERLLVNDTNSLLAAIGPNGVLVFDLPDRTPPFGNFANNKEVIYCRSHSLQERTLAFSTTVECRQVRFHPGSPNDSHLVVLTSDNTIRIFSIENSSAVEIATFGVGNQPSGKLPDKNITYLDAQGETAVDFDFGPVKAVLKQSRNFPAPSSNITQSLQNNTLSGTQNITFLKGTQNLHSLQNRSVSLQNTTIKGQNASIISNFSDLVNREPEKSLQWSIFILYGNGLVYEMIVDLSTKIQPDLSGPLQMVNFPNHSLRDYCSILCLSSTNPAILAIAHCNGTVYHTVELIDDDIQDDFNNDTKQDLDYDLERKSRPKYNTTSNNSLYMFETIELELGLATNIDDSNYFCPIFLHRDFTSFGSYFATHDTGIHSINIPCVDALNYFVNSSSDDNLPMDIFEKSSTAEYLVCTKTAVSEKLNPVLGFSIVVEPHCILTLLANGNLLCLPIKDVASVEKIEEINEQDIGQVMTPLKNMLNSPFDVYVQQILKQSTTQPILKVSENSEHTQQNCYEILQRAGQVFRDEHFPNLERVRQEIEKRLKALKMLKHLHQNEIVKMTEEKQQLQENAELLAEKYEDIKEKQEDLTKRCQLLLVLISKKQAEPSNAEISYNEELKKSDEKIEWYITAIDKLKNKVKYQRNQMANWVQNSRKETGLYAIQAETIKQNLLDTTKKITDNTLEIKQYLQHLNIK